jgi:hypothetical protein
MKIFEAFFVEMTPTCRALSGSQKLHPQLEIDWRANSLVQSIGIEHAPDRSVEAK